MVANVASSNARYYGGKEKGHVLWPQMTSEDISVPMKYGHGHSSLVILVTWSVPYPTYYLILTYVVFCLFK